jgi:hypothetical protein
MSNNREVNQSFDGYQLLSCYLKFIGWITMIDSDVNWGSFFSTNFKGFSPSDLKI